MGLLLGVLVGGSLLEGAVTHERLTLRIPLACVKPLFDWYDRSFSVGEGTRWMMRLSLSGDVIVPGEPVPEACQVRIVVE